MSMCVRETDCISHHENNSALNATKAAIDEGILPGGGVALLKASQVLKDVPYANFDQQLGIAIIRSAISKPIRTIVENAGEEGSVVVGTLLDKYGDRFNWGYDAGKGEYVDMIAAGILDPFKVVKTALVNASGVASLLSTSEACIVDAPEEKGPPMGGGGGVSLLSLLIALFLYHFPLSIPCPFLIAISCDSRLRGMETNVVRV